MDAIAKARADGWTFGGESVVINKDKPKGPVVAKDKPEPKDNGEGVNVYAAAFYRFGEGTEFQYEHEGKFYPASERTACMGCGYSLIGHTCDTMVGLTKHGQKVITVKGR
jgi:hypothetical protein